MAREYRKTEKTLRAKFWREIAPGIPANDKPALREAFHAWTDGLHRDGALTDYQVDRVTLGPERRRSTGAGKRQTAAAALRRALGDLLADVTSGDVKNGGNPWALASVKAASKALTGDRFGFSASEWRDSAK